MCGYQSDTHSPLSPCCANFLRLAMSVLPPTPIGVNTLPKLGGSGSPACLVNSGFGSNRSMWLGPPSMNRKMTLFAFASKCGILGASGLIASISGTSARVLSFRSDESRERSEICRVRRRKNSRREEVENVWLSCIVGPDQSLLSSYH